MSMLSRILVLSFVLVSLLAPNGNINASTGIQPLEIQPVEIPALLPADLASPTLQPDAPVEPKVAAWYNSANAYSTITNCISIIQGFPYQENGMGVFTGFYANPELAQPGIGQVFYAHIAIYGLGNACSGQRAAVEIDPPANTSLAISALNPVKCYAGGVPISPASDCPQVLPASSINPGSFAVLSTDTARARTWPVPQGAVWEFQIPLVSSTLLTNSPMVANVLALDGNSNPWLRPQVGVYVFSSTPSIIYPGPSTEITPGPPATYKSTGYLYSFNLGGTAFFELGTSSAYGLFSDSAVIPAGGTAWELWTDWTPFALQGGTTYHWRIRFVGSNSVTYSGVDQTFTTPVSGQATVGSGTPGSCTGTALNTALGAGTKIVFNCGTAQVTIPMTGMRTISSNVSIDGNNLVTLTAPGFRHFDIQLGGTLALNKITLSGGSVVGCGGSVHVQNGGRLDASYTTFKNNFASGNGGAVCVETGGVGSLFHSLLTNNTATGNGGAVYNLGISELFYSDVSNNNASGNGGGAWNGYFLDIFFSLVSGNTLPNNGVSSGGGVFSNVGLSLQTSTIAGNSASQGAGIFNQNGDAFISSGTISANTAFAANSAGGLDSNGTGHSNVRNTLVAGNTPGNCGINPARTIVSLGNNLDSGSQCLFIAAGDKVNTNPKIGSLSFNGGFTRTVPLMGGSPAIDAADNVYCTMWDQRGFVGSVNDILSRNVDGNGDGNLVCDIGAFEYYPTVFLPMLRR